MTLMHPPPSPQAHSPKCALVRQLTLAGWLGRLPHHTLALAICTLALLLSVPIADDYGVWVDTFVQRAIGEATLRHLAGEGGLNLVWPPTDRLYGPVFEVHLRLIERLIYPQEGRGLYVSRHLLTHLFFVLAGFSGYLLAYRMFGSRWLALFALLLFLLHPRIYAHSFFNSKDVPFLGLFMICLWLAHRAFGASRAFAAYGAAIYGAFALCGVAAGLLTNLRPIGLAFVAVVVFMRLCDVVVADEWRERRRAIASCALFAFASVAAYYATMPYLWADPVERFTEIVTVMLAHPTDKPQFFQGETVLGSELPPTYVPVWFGISTPPLALALGAVGFAALVWRGAVRLGSSPSTDATPLSLAARLAALLGNTPLRFEVLVAACFVLPLLAAVVLRPTLYNDWRHFYFLWAPFVLLATSGLRTLTAAAHSACARFLSQRAPAAAAVGGLAALGLGAIAVEMVRLHPHQHLYFNVLATGPGAAAPLRQRYDMADVFGRARGFAYILEEVAERKEPNTIFNVWMRKYERSEPEWAPRGLGITRPKKDMGLFHQRDQRRFKFDPNEDPDFYVRGRWHILGRPGTGLPPVLYERRLYGQLIAQVATPDLSRMDAATADAYRALYREVTAGAPVLSARGGDVYRDETKITWVKETCRAGDLNHSQAMTVVPLDAGRARETFRAEGVRVGDACLWQTPLPEYAIGKLLLPGVGALASDAYLQERRRRYAVVSAEPPVAQSTFDLYLKDRTLFYIKSPCVQADTGAPFFVHVRPAHLGDLPHSRRRLGFEALDFRLGSVEPSSHHAAGDIFDGVCMATLELPSYPIASIGTGQYTPSASLWRVDVHVGEDDMALPSKATATR